MIPLSPIDHVFTGAGAYPIEFLFVYPGRLDEAALRRGLEPTLADFPPVASVLRRIDDCSLGFEPSPDGCALTTRTLDREPDLTDPVAAYELIDPVESVEGRPMTRIRLTHTPSGSVLGMSLSHCVADGFGFFHFLTNWAGRTRGKSVRSPVHTRAALIPQTFDAGPFTPESVRDRVGLVWGPPRQPPARSQVNWQTLRIPQAEMDALLRTASEHTPRRLSFNDVVSAHLWKRIAAEWNGGTGSTTFTCAFDFRRIDRTLSPLYFGNAIRIAGVQREAGDLAGEPLGVTAAAIADAILSIKPDSIRPALSHLEGLRRAHGQAAMERLHVADPDNGLLVTNLSRMPVLEMDFGSGPPRAIRILTPAPRAAAVLPAADGWEVHWSAPHR